MRRERSKRLPVTEQLVADVIAAGGELRIDTLGDRTNWEHRAQAAVRFGKVPEGKLLVVDRGGSWHELIIRLKDPPAWLTAELEPIGVPASLRKPHPLVAELRDDRDRLRITTAARGRTLRLLQALVSAAEARGYGVRSTRTRPWDRRARNSEPGHLSIVCKQFEVGVSMRQQIDRTDHTPTAAELRRGERESWYRIPKYDETPSERLSLSLSGGRQHRQSVWNDGQMTNLESRLPEILQEIELRAVVAEEQRLEEERRAAEERRRWEAAMERAKADLIESHRASHLLNQLTDWRTANQLREYLAALAHTVEAIDDPEKRAAASEWLSWATNHAARLDPLNQDLAMPPDPEPTPEALKPHLRGWSPYGPHRGRAW